MWTGWDLCIWSVCVFSCTFYLCMRDRLSWSICRSRPSQGSLKLRRDGFQIHSVIFINSGFHADIKTWGWHNNTVNHSLLFSHKHTLSLCFHLHIHTHTDQEVNESLTNRECLSKVIKMLLSNRAWIVCCDTVNYLFTCCILPDGWTGFWFECNPKIKITMNKVDCIVNRGIKTAMKET